MAANKEPVTTLKKVAVKKVSAAKKTNAQYKAERVAKYKAAGRPNMPDWVKAGAGHRGLAGPQKSGQLQTRLKAEKNPGKREALMGAYDKWLDAGRPKMDEWVKMGAGREAIKKAASNRLAKK